MMLKETSALLFLEGEASQLKPDAIMNNIQVLRNTVFVMQSKVPKCFQNNNNNNHIKEKLDVCVSPLP